MSDALRATIRGVIERADWLTVDGPEAWAVELNVDDLTDALVEALKPELDLVRREATAAGILEGMASAEDPTRARKGRGRK